LFLLLIGSGLMALTSPLLAAVVVVMLAISVLAQVRLSRVLERSFDKVQQELARLAAFAQEYLGAARMIAAYAQEQPAVTAFSRANDITRAAIWISCCVRPRSRRCQAW